MPKYDIYLLIADNPHKRITANSQEEAVKKFMKDPFMEEFKKYVDCHWMVVAEKVEDV
jgi:hypothetical protein